MSNIFADGPSPIRLALGTGKYAKQQFAAAAYQQVVDALKSLPTDLAIKYQKRAIRKAAKPGEQALRSEVGQIRSVTGNLAASITTQLREYTNNRQQIPVVVAVIGFRRPVNQKSQRGATPAFAGGSVLKGPNRAYHSHLVEVGTRPRTPGTATRQRRRGRVILGGRIRTRFETVYKPTNNKSGILSSFSTRGPFKAGGRGKYPTDFISTGQVRGSKPLRPLAQAFAASKTAMQSTLDAELRKALRAAARVYQKRTGEIL